MFPHIHLLLGLIIANSLELNNLPLLLFVLGSIFPDIDIIFSIFWKKNHRTFVSHFPMIWLFFCLISAFLKLDVYWFFMAGFLHLLVDVLDWEVYLLMPFSNFKLSLFSLDPEAILQGKTFSEQVVLYYHQKKIIFTELIIFGMFIFSIVLS
ncbi:MAG: metal-dependent hydrolase [Candidatus Hodarchaeales archaeon]